MIGFFLIFSSNTNLDLTFSLIYYRFVRCLIDPYVIFQKKKSSDIIYLLTINQRYQ